MNLEEILKNHALWLKSEGGEKAGLRGADLREADLVEADLRGADLREADLREADLREADLRGADLREADLREADLREADLRGADLRGAGLVGADLREADLRGADLRGASNIIMLGPMPTSGRMLYAVLQEDAYRIYAGCFSGSVSELEEKVKADHNDSTYLAFCEMIRTLEGNLKAVVA